MHTDHSVQDIRVGVIGVGNIGSAHAAALSRGDIPGARLAALSDIDPARRAALAAAYPAIPLFADHLSLLASGEVDAVIVATPHGFHPPIAIDAFRAGVHVLVEKPAGVDVGAVADLNRVAADSGLVFGIMFNQRTDPLFSAARRIIREGRLGEMRRLVWIVTNWYRTQSYYDSGAWRATWRGEGGGVLLNQAPHNLDIWQWLMGMPTRLRAFCYSGKYHDIPVEDDATIYAEYENGATATFITTTGEYPGTNRLEITGDRAKLVIENGELHLWELSEPESSFRLSPAGTPAPTLRETVIPAEKAPSGHILILRNFVDAIRNGTPLIAPGEEGIRELSLSNAAYLSAATDEWVDLPPDPAAVSALLDSLRADEGADVAPNTTDPTTLDTDYRARWQVRW